jgi:hypothetical protein
LINLPDLKTIDILIMFVGYPRHCMGSRKNQGEWYCMGLRKTQGAWYECPQDFLIEKGFKIGRVDTRLFTKKLNDNLFICQVYVDDIIFE